MRDLIGYAGKPPNPQWPNNARLAINFVVNYEDLLMLRAHVIHVYCQKLKKLDLLIKRLTLSKTGLQYS